MTGDTRTLIVVVLYRAANDSNSIETAVTLRCLESAMLAAPVLLETYNVLMWDNSERVADDVNLRFPFDYRHTLSHGAANHGVSGAYNGALEVAIRYGYKWMLLLDDDTEVTADFLDGMWKHQCAVSGNTVIAAIAPLLFERDFQLSPQQVLTHRHRPVAPGAPRILVSESFAANSGVMIRTAALKEIGGYSVDFWLDYSDIELFRRLYRAGKQIFLAADLRLQHSMTMLDYDGRMTTARYTNFLYAEQAYYDLYQDISQNAVYVLRLLARVLRQRRYRNKAFSTLTRTFLVRRLTTSKARRLMQWKQRRMDRQAGMHEPEA